MKFCTSTLSGLAALMLLGAGGVQAALQPYTSQGVNLVYSTDQDLTWTADANLFNTLCEAEGVSNCPNLIAAIIAAGSPVTHAGSEKYPSPHTVVATEFNQDTGGMSWFAAKAWVAYLNSITYGGTTNWRLWSPGPDPICPEYNCTGSEFGYLFYAEGGLTAGNPITNSNELKNVFINLQDSLYWSSTEDTLARIYAWGFFALDGRQVYDWKDYQFYAWAVRPGQVAPPQPIPTVSVWGLGLLGLLLAGLARARLW